ncbi:hypothetical protein [Mycobacterium sherrisii]|uniref:hypothetical protein n=1 Tax=Mycobacterium sherrisii TaxID=243061 RepID=UPI000A25AB84|nr:hypothetical protein [Mycobacterium sherrisii]MCV7032538.1 hypothetical protein [Mycobacterium sherrisii]ORW74197.1 hypothetical protein AWC25_00455 [Mycobacterium sherrisii]
MVMTAIMFTVAAATTWYLLRGRRGIELRFRILVIIGGMLCAASFEPAADRFSLLWYASEGGQWRLITIFGIHVPLWQLGTYTWFVGGASLFAIDRLRAGGGARAMWQIYWAIVAIDIFIEVPLSHVVTLYAYHGDHNPFFSDFWRLPAWMIFVNGAMPLAAAAAALSVCATGNKAMLWLIPVIVPGSQFGLYATVSWPTIAAINSDVGPVAAHIIGAGTIALELIVAGYLLCNLLPRIAAMAQFPEQMPAAVHGSTP